MTSNKRGVYTYLFILFYCWVFLWILFTKKFGFSFDALPFYDDYLETYCMSIKGIQMLFEGGVFGWDYHNLGGYPVAYTGATIISFVFLPFYMIFQQSGYQLMLLFLWFAFPLTVSFYAHTLFHDWKITVQSIVYATIFFLLYLSSFIHCGNMHDLAGIVVFAMTFAFYENISQGKRLSFFLCVLSLTLLYYTYAPYAIFFIMFTIIEWVTSPRKAALFRIIFISLFLFLTTLHYNWYYIKFRDYLSHDFRYFKPHVVCRCVSEAFHCFYGRVIQSFSTVEGCFIVLGVFILILGLRVKALKKFGIISAVIISIYLLADTMIYTDYLSRILPGRIICFIPIFASIVFAYRSRYLKIEFKYVLSILCSIILIVFLLVSYKTDMKPMFKTTRDYNNELYDQIVKLDGNLILFENVSWHNLLNKKDDSRYSCYGKEHLHLAGLLAMQTGKNFFSTTHEGWHETVFRGNCLNSGVFRGRLISDVDITEMEKMLNKWGVSYLVIWNEFSKEYFLKFKNKFKIIWQDDKWLILKHIDADKRQVVVPVGEGQVVKESYFSKEVAFTDVRQGDAVVVRFNYFPAWKAYYKNKETLVVNVDGQLALSLPDRGSYNIVFRFPKYPQFTVIALIAFILTAVLSGNKKFQGLITAQEKV